MRESNMFNLHIILYQYHARIERIQSMHPHSTSHISSIIVNIVKLKMIIDYSQSLSAVTNVIEHTVCE